MKFGDFNSISEKMNFLRNSKDLYFIDEHRNIQSMTEGFLYDPKNDSVVDLCSGECNGDHYEVFSSEEDARSTLDEHKSKKIRETEE